MYKKQDLLFLVLTMNQGATVRIIQRDPLRLCQKSQNYISEMNCNLLTHHILKLKKQEKNLSWITKGNKNLEAKIGTKLKPKANFNPGSFLCWRLVGQTQPMPTRLFKTGKKAASGSFCFRPSKPIR